MAWMGDLTPHPSSGTLIYMKIRAVETGPEWVSVQMQVRVPWWRREQLADEARAAGQSMAVFLADAIDRVYPPVPPK